MRLSSSQMPPPVAGSRPAIRLSVVDLPQPDGPSSAMNSPFLIVRETSLSALCVPKSRLSRSSLSSRKFAALIVMECHRSCRAGAGRLRAGGSEAEQAGQDLERQGNCPPMPGSRARSCAEREDGSAAAGIACRGEMRPRWSIPCLLFPQQWLPAFFIRTSLCREDPLQVPLCLAARRRLTLSIMDWYASILVSVRPMQ
jgi:hypothetical protein